MDRQTLRDWVHRFNAEGPEGLYSKPGLGPSCRLSEAQQQELAALIEAGPDLAKHGVVRFRLCDLCALVEERFGVTYGEQGLSKLIKKLGSPPAGLEGRWSGLSAGFSPDQRPAAASQK